MLTVLQLGPWFQAIKQSGGLFYGLLMLNGRHAKKILLVSVYLFHNYTWVMCCSNTFYKRGNRWLFKFKSNIMTRKAVKFQAYCKKNKQKKTRWLISMCACTKLSFVTQLKVRYSSWCEYFTEVSPPLHAAAEARGVVSVTQCASGIHPALYNPVNRERSNETGAPPEWPQQQTTVGKVSDLTLISTF